MFHRSYSRFLHASLGKRHLSKKCLDISGVYPPIATPFNLNGQVANDKLKENMEKFQQHPLRGFVALGSTGEYVYMTLQEKVEMVAEMKKHLQKDRLLLAGTGMESTVDTIILTCKMAEVGADAALVATPGFYKSSMTNSALIAHYIAVADASPIPIILYSVPGMTGVDMQPEVPRICSQHNNIIGMKDSGGNISKMGLIVSETRETGFQVIAGGASFLLPSMAVGCVGGINAFANLLPAPLCEIYTLCTQGKWAEALQLHLTVIRPSELSKVYGIAGVKAGMDMLGYYGGPVRSPLLPLDTATVDKIRMIFKQSGYLA